MSWSSWSSCLWVFWATWIVGLRFIAPLIIDNEFDISLDLSVKALNLYAHFICDINFSQNISIFLRPIQKSETIHFIPLFTLLILIASAAKRLCPSTAISSHNKTNQWGLNSTVDVSRRKSELLHECRSMESLQIGGKQMLSSLYKVIFQEK